MIVQLLNENKITQLNEYLSEIHAHDIVSEIQQLTDLQKKHFYRVVSIDIMSEVLPYLTQDEARLVILRYPIEKQVEVLNEMTSDDLVDLLSTYPFKTRNQIIPLLNDSEAIKNLLKYKENETGSFVSFEVIKVLIGTDVKFATKQLIKQAPDVESITSIFVVDENNCFVGVIPFKKLIKAKSPMLVDELIDTITPVCDTDDIETTVKDMVNYKIYEMPVVDEHNHFLGAVSYDDAFDIYIEEAQEDFEKLAALPDTKNESTFKTAWHRAPWLIILIILSIPVALLTESFEAMVSGIAILVVFQPVILDTPGNIATQTLAVTLTQLNDNGRISLKDFLKEMLSALFTAIVMSVIAFLFSYIFMLIKNPGIGLWHTQQHYLVKLPLIFAGVLALSLFAVVVIAPLLAIVIPMIFQKIKIDPSLASGPFITTIIDVVSNSIYFGIAILLLVKTGVLFYV